MILTFERLIHLLTFLWWFCYCYFYILIKIIRVLINRITITNISIYEIKKKLNRKTSIDKNISFYSKYKIFEST